MSRPCCYWAGGRGSTRVGVKNLNETLSLYQPNLDQLGKEISSHSYDSGMAQRLEKVFQEDLKYSERITYERWKSRRIFQRFIEFFAFPIKEQL